MNSITDRDFRLRTIALILLAVTLVLMPAPVRASCLLPAPGDAPQPLAEPCDSVLLSYGGVNIQIVIFDISLALAILVVPVLTHLLCHILLNHLVRSRSFDLIPDPPPPRNAVSVDPIFEAERAPTPADRRHGSRLCWQFWIY